MRQRPKHRRYDRHRIWWIRLLCIPIAVVAATSCARNQDEFVTETFSQDQTIGPHVTSELHCMPEAWRPPPMPWPSPTPEVPVPDVLTRVQSPIKVEHCEALDPQPRFPGQQLSGLTYLVDCNDRIVRFRTRDFATGVMSWQLNERTQISPTGEIDQKIMLYTRLAMDARGQRNCWARLLGHVTGRVECPADPRFARVQLKTRWSFDPTPPEVMEAPAPQNADLRNGAFCELAPGTCTFTNEEESACNGS